MTIEPVKETEKLLQSQSRGFDQQSTFQQPRPQDRNVTNQKPVQPVVQQTRDPRLPNTEVTITDTPQQPLDPLSLLQNQPDILAGLIQNNPSALLIATQGTPQQKQELLQHLQTSALLIAAQGSPQQQQELMNQLLAQQQQNMGMPNLGMASIGQQAPQLQNTNFGMSQMHPQLPIGAPINSNLMNPQQQFINPLQNSPLLIQGNNLQPQQQHPPQQFRGGHSKRGGRPYSNRGRF